MSCKLILRYLPAGRRILANEVKFRILFKSIVCIANSDLFGRFQEKANHSAGQLLSDKIEVLT